MRKCFYLCKVHFCYNFFKLRFFPLAPERQRFLLPAAETPDSSGLYRIFLLLPVKHHLPMMWRFEVRRQEKFVMQARLTHSCRIFCFWQKKKPKTPSRFSLFSHKLPVVILNSETSRGGTVDLDWMTIWMIICHTELVKHVLPQPVTLWALVT